MPLAHLYVKSMILRRIAFPLPILNRLRGSSFVELPHLFLKSAGHRDNRRPACEPSIRSRNGKVIQGSQFGSSFNPGKFQASGPAPIISGNYLVYLMASQAIWRKDKQGSMGLDLTAATDFTPSNRSPIGRQTTLGVRYNKPLPLRQHNTISFGYVQSQVSHTFPAAPSGSNLPSENALELNGVIHVTRSITLQPVVERLIHMGGSARQATVFGFRSKVDF